MSSVREARHPTRVKPLRPVRRSAYGGSVRVVFCKDERALCWWTAYPPKRRPITSNGGRAGRGLPHDLAQFLVERDRHHRYGFWGCLAEGATFRSLVKSGRKRTRPGTAVIAAHVEELDAAESDANFHVGLWRNGRPTPLAALLDDYRRQWLHLRPGDTLELEFTPAVVGRRRT
jgi:hypothetical protein